MFNIELEENQNVWFTSDTHYNHKNICRGESSWSNLDNTRNYNNLYHMNQIIVDNINNNVMPNDVLIHLGDWSFGGFDKIEEFRKRISCENIYLILGNHDHHILNNRDNCRKHFKKVESYLDLRITWVEKKGAVSNFEASCCHYPIASWNNMNKGRCHLHGHVHLPPNLKLHEGRALDVGMDGHPEFRPYSLSEIKKLVQNRPIKKLVLPKDHHEADT